MRPFRTRRTMLLPLLLVAQNALAQQAPPHPREVFGFEPGADYELADYGQMLEYFRRLDEASDRVLVEEIGTSVLGRPLILVYVSSEENIARLDRWRAISERLARARDLDDDEARRLAQEGRAIVWIDGGLHASEVAGSQHSPLLAYRVATEESAEMRRIRENVILLLMPVMNPDGLDIVVDWYRSNLGTPFETAPLPWLYHHYAGHDNNRDWFMITQPETEAVSRKLYHEWYPQIVYDHHQVAPFPARIFVPPFADPVNPNIPPRVVAGVDLVGDAMARRFAQEDKPGVVSRVQFDMWWNGGMRTAPYFHNMVGILAETALHHYATPRYYDPAELPRWFGFGSDLSAWEPSTSYANPWRGGWWRLRDAVDYMITGAMAVLDIAARRKDDWLYDFYRMGREAIERGRAGGPFAYLIPDEDQWDRGEAVELVNVLRRGGLEVHRATEAFTADGGRYPSGTYIVYAGQAFRPYAVDLLERQVYPDMRQYPGGPPRAPYDVSGWTLPIQMGVRVVRIERPFEARTEPVDAATVRPGRVEGGPGVAYLLSHRPNATVLAVNLLLRAGERVSWAGGDFELGGVAYDAGTIVIRDAGRRTRERIEALARELGLDITSIRAEPGVPLHPLRLPRVGLYKSWVANVDEGWTRWLLERYEFDLDTLDDARIRREDLTRYDAIVLPDQSAGEILNGHAPGTMPPRYVGGLGVEGAAALKRYVERGGTLVALDGASDFVIRQFGLPLRNAVAGVPEREFFIPGSLLRIEVNTRHPVAYGMPAEAAAYFVRSRAFDPIEPARNDDPRAEASRVEVIARYPDGERVLSGWALGERRHLAGKAAAVRVRVGRGDAVLIGFRPQFRAQPRGTFKLLFNALHAATLSEYPSFEGVAATVSPGSSAVAPLD